MLAQRKTCWGIKAKEEVLLSDRPDIKDKSHPQSLKKKSSPLKNWIRKILSVCAMCEGAAGDQKRALDPLQLELQQCDLAEENAGN